jgi:hypothetical protein
MDLKQTALIIKNWLANYLKSHSYFSEKSDHDRKLDIADVEAQGDGVLVRFKVGESWNVNDPQIRKTGRLAIEALRQAQPPLAALDIKFDFAH